MDEKLVLEPMQLVLRAVWIVFTGMAALAFIVISFVADTWDSVPLEKQHFAFVVVSASGAHFIFSLAYVLPSLLVCRFLPYWSVATSLCVGGAGYIYSALILQHRGLADMLTAEPWVSVFPLGQRLIGLVQGPDLELYFYFTPLVIGWLLAIVSGLLLGLAEYRFRKRRPAPPRQKRRAKS